MKNERRVDLKEFRATFGTRRLSFANEEVMKDLFGVTPGSVSPLGLLNDPDCHVKFFIDKDFVDGMIGVHPNENTATVWLKTTHLLNIIKEHGNEVQVI